MSHTILFDFDGTVAVGDGPVRAFATKVSQQLIEHEQEGFVREIFAALDEAERNGFTAEQRDGYGLVNLAAQAAQISAEALNESYHASRELLGSEHATITAPEGLREFLSALPEHTRAVLVTNAPNTRITEALEAMGLSGLFDEVICSAKKPFGLTEIARPFAERGTIAGVGDIWVNDLEPLIPFDAFTALIGAPGDHEPPHAVGNNLTDLLPALTEWVHSRPTPTHIPTSSLKH